MTIKDMVGRRVDSSVLPCDYEPGDYGKRGSRWFACLPTGILGHLDNRWIIIEHEDGTTTLGDPLSDQCSEVCAARDHAWRSV